MKSARRVDVCFRRMLNVTGETFFFSPVATARAGVVRGPDKIASRPFFFFLKYARAENATRVNTREIHANSIAR